MVMEEFEEPGLFPRLHKRTTSSIAVQWTYIRDDSWMPVDHFLLEYNSSHDPEYQHIELHPSERLYTINNCTSGSKYSLTITSIDINGRAIIRAKPLVIEASAPIERPALKLLHNEPGAITFGWNTPRVFGDGHIQEYQLQVNGKDYAKIISTQNEATYTDCRPLRTYTFRLQAISTVPDCDSEFSRILDVTCPGALPISLERAHSHGVNKVKVAWNRPICQGGARVREYKLYYLKVDDENYHPTKEEIMKNEKSILHTLSPVSVEDSLKVEPDKYYWAFLEAEIVPDGCPDLVTASIQLHAAKKPHPPEISVDVYGLKERMAFGKEIDYIVDKRDRNIAVLICKFSEEFAIIIANTLAFHSAHRLKTNLNAMNNSVLAKGEKVRDEEIQRKRVLLHRVEKRLRELLNTINDYTGSLSIVLKITPPCFDQFCEPMGYRVMVDNEIYANLPLDTKKYCMKLGVEKAVYDIFVVTLSGHVVGHSKPSEVVQISSMEFRPIRFFCYFSSHNKQASWPDNGGCCLEDTLEYERQYSDKPFPQRSFINERVHAHSFHVMGVFDGVWEPLGKHLGKAKPTALLFWTKWCASSRRVMEYYTSFAKEHSAEYQLLSCCVFSGEPITNHQSKVMDVMTDHGWTNTEGVKHFCACHPGPNSKLRKRDIENSSFAKAYRLLGVPTLVLIDSEGYISWQGRIFADNAETFSNYLLHTLSVITKSDCPIKHCDHCDSEVYGLLYSDKEKPAFTRKDLTIEHFNIMMAKQIEAESELKLRRKELERIEGHSGDEAEYLDTTRSIGSSKSYSVRFSEDFSIASPDSQRMSTTTNSRAGTSLESRLDNIQGRPKTGSVTSARIRSSRSGDGRENSPGLNKVQPEVSKGSPQRSNSNLAKPASRNSSQDGRITRSRSVGLGGRSNTAQSNTRTPTHGRAASALPNIGRGREKVSLPPRPKTSSSMYRSKQYNWVQSRYAPDNYVPFNPYRGKSYYKNGAVMTLYSKTGYIPVKPFPKDTSKHKVSWKSKTEIPKQKVPSHREIKYMRRGDNNEKH